MASEPRRTSLKKSTCKSKIASAFHCLSLCQKKQDTKFEISFNENDKYILIQVYTTLN
jgi:hypothetical protein